MRTRRYRPRDPVSGAPEDRSPLAAPRLTRDSGLLARRDNNWRSCARPISVDTVVIVDADGGNPVTLARRASPTTDEDGFDWAPDGSAVAVTGRVAAANRPLKPAGRINLVDASDGTVTSIGPAYLGFEFAWRPPDGRQLLFVGAWRHRPRPAALRRRYRARRGGAGRPCQAGQDEIRLAGWTADGTRYAYLVETPEAGMLSTRVVDIATGAFVDVPVAYGHLSNDGTRIAGLVGNHGGEPCVASVAGGECRPIGTPRPGARRAHTTPGMYWSPDDRWVVSRPASRPAGAVLLDPDGSAVDQPAWLADGAESWQRVP